MMGQKRLKTITEEGIAKAKGDTGPLDKLAASIVTFAPNFEMVPGTKRPAPVEEANPCEADVDIAKVE